MELLNQVRGHHFLLGVFRGRQADPYCAVCSAYANTLKAARESFAALEQGNADALRSLSPEFSAMLAETRSGLASVTMPAAPSGQKKAGNCKLPEGVCFIKASFALLQKI
ncbi:MAG: hypothetical protein ACYC7L_08485 [Nitrospirota bacterium]